MCFDFHSNTSSKGMPFKKVNILQHSMWIGRVSVLFGIVKKNQKKNFEAAQPGSAEEQWNAMRFAAFKTLINVLTRAWSIPIFLASLRRMMTATTTMFYTQNYLGMCWMKCVVSLALRVDNAWRENEIMRIHNEKRPCAWQLAFDVYSICCFISAFISPIGT